MMGDLSQIATSNLAFIVGVVLCFVFIKSYRFIAKKQFNKFKLRLYRYVIANYTSIDKEEFILGECRWNHKCHYNSIQAIKEDKASKVLMCYVMIDNQIFLHYINQDNKGKYIDNTFGWRFEHAEYYFIREIVSSEYKLLPSYITTLNNAHIKLLGRIPFRQYCIKEQNNNK